LETTVRGQTLLTENYITSSCKIDQGIVFKDGLRLFENNSARFQSFSLAAYQHFGLNYPKFYKMDNLCKLGWLASEILLEGNFRKENYRSEDIGLVLANKNSSLDNDIRYFESSKEIASPSLFVYTLPNIVIGEICIRNQFKGEHAFFIQNTFDAAFIEQQVSYLLSHDVLKACICGWVDVLEPEYKAVLFLVEKANSENKLPFSAEKMSDIFNKI
jgi:hypothetical protein